jgi:hypothetical protein
MTVLRNCNLWDKSNVIYENGRLLCYDKSNPRPDMHFIDYGAALLRRAALLRLPADQVCDLADFYRDLVAEGRMVGYEVTRRFYEIGSPAGLEETERYLRANLLATSATSAAAPKPSARQKKRNDEGRSQ